MPSLRTPRLILLLSLACSPGACADSSDELPDPDPDADPLIVPTDADSLLPWLVAEAYLEWPVESAIHGSTGPHFGNVRTWIHPDLADSLDAGLAQHPAGAGAVKELYGSGSERRGWAVQVKTADDSAGGDGWYWYEYYDGATVAAGDGIGLCAGCHGSGVDYVRTPWPLQ